ncbi:MAG: UDP-N-acetylmuramoyl-L-alanine--D-glutamate ligase [Gammaproteobacteria bacterium]|nr:UDP-N-acetylmuramoyl-L-alanine--D-glutamate ligase [Gammaproteobacteria bacterium]
MNVSQHERHTLIVGLGVTGLSCVRYLSAQGDLLAVTDTRTQPPALKTLECDFPDVAVFPGGFDADAFHCAERIIVSPGVAMNHPMIVAAQAQGIEVIGDVELFAREVQAPVVAITGSNGKSTVTTLLGEMARVSGCQVQVGGNLGVPVLDLLADADAELFVLELSSFQLETLTSLSPRVAVVLNVSPDHLDRYESYAQYCAVKDKVYQHAQACVVNRDEARLAVRQSVISYGLSEPQGNDFGLCDREGVEYLCQGQELWLAVSELRMPGRHNISNALAALALGVVVGLQREAMVQVLRDFRGLPHRTQWVAECNGVRWFDDSKGTNVGATRAALQGLDCPLLLIAGGQAKGADFSPLREVVKNKVRVLLLMGEDAGLIETALGSVVKVIRVNDMQEAVRCANDLAQPGDGVLLSPACASFDMYSGYEERGQDFVTTVRGVLA